MNHFTKFVFLLLASASVFIAAPAGAAEVQLVKAVRGFCGGSSGSGGTICIPHRFTLLVEDLAYEKEVGIHYEKAFAGQYGWDYAAAEYAESIDDSTELWVAEIPNFQTVGEFVAQYEVAGSTYWDNNGGDNYDLGGGAALGHAFHVAVHPRENVCAACTPGYDLGGHLLPLSGSVYVRNLAYEKDVTVVFTRDEWATVQSIPATWQSGPNTSNVERFSFGIDWQSASSISFAIGYEANNQTIWDNNFGRDYWVERP